MDKITYLAELAEGLARWVPERERQDILRYYAEYFQEAGEEREAEVVAELGDPWALSSRLAVEGGFVSQEQARNWTPRKKRKVWPWVLAGSLLLAAALIGTGVMAAFKLSRSILRGDVIGWAGSDRGIITTDEYAQAVPVVPGGDSGAVTYYFEDGDSTSGFWTMEDGYLEPFDIIDAEVGLGNVTVTAGDDYTLFINQGDGLAGYHQITWEVKDGKLKIRDKSGKELNIGGLKNLSGEYGVDVAVTVPEGTWLDKVSVKTGLGSVFVSGVDTEKVTAETGLGNVECYEVRQVKKLNLATGMGNVTMGIDELWEGADIDLESGMGNVEANLGCVESECGYELKTGMGKVTVNGGGRGTKAESKGGRAYKLEAESGMGDVSVYFQND